VVGTGIVPLLFMKKKAHPYRPKDVNQLAKYLVELSTGEREEQPEEVISANTVKKKKLKDRKNKDG